MDESGWYGLAGRLTRERDECRAEIANLRAELAERKATYQYNDADIDLLNDKIDIAEAAARQDAEDRAAYIEAAEKRGYDCGVNDITRQDAEEIARLRELVKEALQSAPPGTGFQARCRAALACRPQPARNRPLPETRCDCCDNGLDDAWEFCPFCGQQHPDATADACRPQGSET